VSERETVTPTGGGGSISRRDALRITAVGGLGLAFGGALARAALERAGLERVRETRARLGTLVTLTAVHPDAEAARRSEGSAGPEDRAKSKGKAVVRPAPRPQERSS